MTSEKAAFLQHAIIFRDELLDAETIYRSGRLNEGLQMFDNEWPQIQYAHDWLTMQRPSKVISRLIVDYMRGAPYVLDHRLTPEQMYDLAFAARSAARYLKDVAAEGAAETNLGIASKNMGKFDAAFDHHERALHLSEQAFDHRGVMNALGNLGIMYDHKSSSDEAMIYKAIDCYERQLTLLDSVVFDEPARARALINLGFAYIDTPNVNMAVEKATEAISMTIAMKDERNESKAYQVLGLAYFALGNARDQKRGYKSLYKSAIMYHKMNIKKALIVKDRHLAGYGLYNLTDVLIKLEQFKKSVYYGTQCVTIFEEFNDPNLTAARELLSIAQHNLESVSVNKQRLSLQENQADFRRA